MPSPHAVPPSRPAALIVDRYAVYDEFASGGMATVHFARLIGAQGFRRTVAAKRLLPHLTRDRDFALMLVDEARLAARVRHPNVVSTLDVVQTESELLLVMDYVHGESLATLARAVRARGERVPLAIATAIIIDTLHGLHAAHEARDERGQPLALVHRDVSPHNVLVGLDGITRIADFGVAKASGRAQTTRDGAIKGKLAYMAPEQISGGGVARTTDVFAAAVVLWELLTGETLFAGSSHAATVFAVMAAPITPPSERAAGVSPELEAIVMRGLCRDPAQRFCTAREMALALEACAPSVRPSEIAAWIERIAGEGLARRAQLLSVIEHEGEADDEDASTQIHVGASAPEPAALSASEGGTGRRLRESLSDDALAEISASGGSRPSGRVSGSGQAAARSSQPDLAPGLAHASRVGIPSKRLSRGSLALGGLVLLLALAWLAAAQRSGSHAPAAAVMEDREPAVAPSALTPTSAPSRAAQAPSPSAPALEGRSAPAAAPASSAARSLATPEAAPALGPAEAAPGHVAAPSDKRRARPSAHKSTNNRACDPPYTRDAAGRLLFKVECM